MKVVHRKGGDQERRVLVGMILCDEVAGKISEKMKEVEGGEPFRSRWANLVAGWVSGYYSQYEKAPGRHIEPIFRQWASTANDEKQISLVERFLEAVSDEAEGFDINPGFIIDLAGSLFNQVQLERHVESVQAEVDQGRVEKALSRAESFRKIEIGQGAGIDLFQDKEAVRAAFSQETHVLVTYPGPLGQFMGDRLKRDALISFMAPEKRGKSWWLIDLAWRAMLQRRKVCFFAVGDMGQDEMIQRLMIRASHHPEKAGTIEIPVSIEEGEGGVPSIDVKAKKFHSDLCWQKAWISCRQTMKKRVRSKQSFFKLSCHPADSISVEGIGSILKGWSRDAWEPDVIVIDYADILAAPSGRLDYRHQIDATWKKLRSLAHSLNCLVVTATQSDAASYETRIISKRNFSEDKRKLAHVNGMIGINQTPEEEEIGAYRLNWIVTRRGRNNSLRCVSTAACLDVGNPAVLSTW